MTAPPIYISGLSYELGELAAIESLPELVRDGEALRFLRMVGCRHFARLERPMGDVLVDVGRKALDRARIARSEIGAIVYASSTFDASGHSNDIPRLAAALGLDEAIPYGIFLGNCTNFSLGLSTARALVRDAGRSVLLLSADCIATSGRASRIPDKRICVLSDGVVGAVVTAQDRGGYELCGIDSRHRGELYQLDRQSTLGEVSYIEAMGQAVADVCASLRQRLGLAIDDFAWIVTGNYHAQIMQSYAELAGFSPAMLFRDNLPRFGHSFAADQLIALADLADSGRITRGDNVLLVGTSDFLWSATVARAR